MAWNEDKEPEVTPPGPDDVERITYDAVCTGAGNKITEEETP